MTKTQLQALLVIGGIGAALALIQLLGIAGGTALVLIGVPLGLALEAPGGLLTAIGGGMAIVGVAFGYPTAT